VVAFLLVIGCLVPAGGAAAARVYSVLVDVDNNTATGCSVAVQDQGTSGTFSGAEFVLRATESNYSILSIHQQNCEFGSLGSSTLVNGTATAVPANRSGGLAIEFSIPTATIHSNFPSGQFDESVRLGFLAGTSQSSSDDVLQSTDGTSTGAPILLAVTGFAAQVPAMPVIAQIAAALFLMVVGVRIVRRGGSAPVLTLLFVVALAGISLAQFTSGDALGGWTQSAIAYDPSSDSLGADRELEILSAYAQQNSTDILFRLDVAATPPVLSDDGTQYTVAVTAPVQVGHLNQEIRNAFGVDVFLRDQFSDAETVPAGNVSATTVDGLTQALGVETWTIGSETDDPALALRLPVTTDAQQGTDPVPCTNCTGEMEDGWSGTPSLPDPRVGSSDPPDPDGVSTDKSYVPDLEDPVKDTNQEPPATAEAGQHARVLLTVSEATAGLVPVLAVLNPGDVVQARPPRIPPVGSVVCVTKSSEVAEDQGIISLHVIHDPFLERSYEPPDPSLGSHGTDVVTVANVSCPVTVPADSAEGVAGIALVSLELWRVSNPLPLQPADPRNLDADVLTPAYFLANQSDLEFLGQLSNPAIQTLLATPNASLAQPTMMAPAAAPATMTQLHSSGSRANKFNFVVIGDGFANNAADQNLFNNYVATTVISQFFALDIHPEVLNAINIFRINTFSTQSGITLVDANGLVTTAVDTALSYRYSGVWNRCWMEPSPGTQALLNTDIAALVPEADGIAVVLNIPNFGGCARSGHFAVTRTTSAATFAHEFGHFFGGLGDEYFCPAASATCLAYAGPARGEQNLTISTSGNTVKWREWIPSWRPTPTAPAQVADAAEDIGIFAGTTTGNAQWWTGMYRPSNNARMNSNAPEHNPVGYKTIRDIAYTQQEGDFRETAVGDFDGDTRTDLVMIDDRQLSLHRAADRNVGPADPVSGSPPRNVTGVLDPTFYVTDILRNPAETRSWEFRKNDILLPGDFDGDGDDDLYVVNLVDWNKPYLVMLRSTGTGFEPVRRYDLELPGWSDMRANDQFYVGDFSGDGKADLMVYNGLDWAIPYFIMLQSDGGRLVASKRYDQYLPGWEMGRHERFIVGNYDGDVQGKADVIAFNTNDWAQVHLQVQLSTGSTLTLRDRHYGTISGNFWAMRRNDELYSLDFNDDGTDDIAIWNGYDWSRPYLGLATMNGEGVLTAVRRYDDHPTASDNPIPGWGMRRADRHWVADYDGDGDEDLVVLNTENWSTEYLGMLRSDGVDQLSGSWQDDWIGGWNLGSVDSLHVADFRGSGGWEDLFIFNEQWLGLLRSQSAQYSLEAIYPKWIHNHRYNDFGLW